MRKEVFDFDSFCPRIMRECGSGVLFYAGFYTTSPFVGRRTTRGGGGMFILSRPRKNEPRKRTKGFNTPWHPAMRLCRRAKRAARRKSERLQILRARLKESRTHGSCTDVAFAKDDSFCLFPCDRRNFEQNEIAKSLAQLTHLGRALMRPRWGSFAGLCFSALLFSERRTAQFPKAAAFGFLSFALSL